ncbi:MAG: hypothetical protein FJX46_06500 [Alphaproteobacteria bacterium]|nr:hypothetical protein [Alphaproteobacteria bacterium]
MTQLRLLFFGDSIANGTGDSSYLGWPGRLCAAERARGHDLTLYNLGVRADTSAQIRRRWRSEAEARWRSDVAQALVFAFGVNDSAEEGGGAIRVPLDQSLQNAEAMLTEAKALAPVLWIGPAPIADAMQPLRPSATVSFHFRNRVIADYVARYRELAVRMGVPFLDTFEALGRAPAWARYVAAGDGVHPAAEGYAMLARLVDDWPAWRRWMGGA